MEHEDEGQADTSLVDAIVLSVKLFVIGCVGLGVAGLLTWIVEVGQ